MPRYIAKSFVQQPVLEAIVRGTYDKTLSPEEKAIVQAVPEDARGWFEESVVNGLYLPLRGALKDRKKTLRRLAAELLPLSPLSAEEAGQQGRTTRLNLREKFERRKGTYLAYSFLPKDASFQEHCTAAIVAYVERIRGFFANEVAANASVKSVTADDVIKALDRA